MAVAPGNSLLISMVDSASGNLVNIYVASENLVRSSLFKSDATVCKMFPKAVNRWR